MKLYFGLCVVVVLQCISLSVSIPFSSNFHKDSGPLRYNFPLGLNDVEKRQECVDKRNCTWVRVVYHLNTQVKLEKFCEEYKVLRLIKDCQKTCGHCKLPAPPAPEPLKCEDERADCSVLTKLFNGDRARLDDYCDSHKKDEAIKQCRYTCGFCKAPAPEKECKDERNDCHNIITIHKGDKEAVKKYCDKFLALKDPAVLQCKKTCGACGKAPHPPKPIECKDERSNCHRIVEMFKGDKAAMQDYCDTYIRRKDPTILACKKTCGACKAPAPPEPVKVCEDTREGGCSWIKKIKDPSAYCKQWKDDNAVKQCQKTCGFCK